MLAKRNEQRKKQGLKQVRAGQGSHVRAPPCSNHLPPPLN